MKNNGRIHLIRILKKLWGGVYQSIRVSDYSQLPYFASEYYNDVIKHIEFERYPQFFQIFNDIYNILIRIAETQKHQGMLADLKKQIQKFVEALQNEKNIIYEIVFLPYKSEMWNCMDSVYRTAVADPNCEIYVIPVPYFILGPDGKEQQFFYEADAFPEDITITDYLDYDISKKLPDIIYIHNPFDEINTITKTPPEYWSSNLCKFTRALVYIPYFSVLDKIDELHTRELPAYQYCDIIALQNEQVLKDISEQNDPEKFQVLGSPIFDAVLRKNENPKTYPVEWGKRAKGKTCIMLGMTLGIIFDTPEIYFRNYKHILMTINSDSFKKEFPDVIFIYRPHPLLRQILLSRPDIDSNTLDELEEALLSNERIILDTSADYVQAAAACEAYIGEWSSITMPFHITGKPIFLIKGRYFYETCFSYSSQDINNCPYTRETDQFRCKPFPSIYLRGQDLRGIQKWLSRNEAIYFDIVHNAICALDIESGDIRIVYKLDLEAMLESGYITNLQKHLYSEYIQAGEKLVFTPNKAKAVMIYSLAENQARFYPIYSPANGVSLDNSVILGETILFLPRSYNKFVLFDIKTERLEYVNPDKTAQQFISMRTEVAQVRNNTDSYSADMSSSHFPIWGIYQNFDYMTKGTSMARKHAYFPSLWSNQLMYLELAGSELNVEAIPIGDTDNIYMAVYEHQGVLWIIESRGSLLQWDIEKKMIIRSTLPPEGFLRSDIPKSLPFQMVPYEDGFIGISIYSNMFLYISHEGVIKEFIMNFSQGCLASDHMETMYYGTFKAGSPFTFVARIADDVYLIFSNYYQQFALINTISGSVRLLASQIKDVAGDEYASNFCRAYRFLRQKNLIQSKEESPSNIYVEYEAYGVIDFLRDTKNHNPSKINDLCIDGNAGKRIQQQAIFAAVRNSDRF